MEKEVSKYFAELIRDIIDTQGLKQYELAVAMGVSAQSISRWLNPGISSDIPGWGQLKKLSELSGKSLDELSGEKAKALRAAVKDFSESLSARAKPSGAGVLRVKFEDIKTSYCEVMGDVLTDEERAAFDISPSFGAFYRGYRLAERKFQSRSRANEGQ